ncbi:67 kDa myosin-cross-reactive antigen family protein [Aspergillus nomiae NRRL 13137]|uniref:67 kDa myosin-cross-reactive antigen family protein n=1 Tax=Aspergillus nomiae NRRL (strain ATCC 15546 / NRRL 13137 / CBS 260.88 / M93) TaxID=1509407 RepID=A0A0L1JFA5_ASPN3|nr:67 kDa myosin-cross-reactive antigen family protein [Aspergillus nomiae NRRL 13137]KNG90460.1 67 kDa myosin-cross-reactive antigen family protein [Aspergillus nomiae NRRL 13137]
MDIKSSTFKRDAQNVQAWLVGNGLASLAAAVYLTRECNVPGRNIHILDLHPGFEGEMATLGDAENGYFLPYQCLPHVYGTCIEGLLSLVPSILDSDKSLLGDIQEFGRQHQSHPKAPTTPGTIRLKAPDSRGVYTEGFQLGLKHRLELIKVILESEKTLASKKINEAFDKSFFETGFWLHWSRIFAFQPWHSVIEFRRHLRKYLEDIRSLHDLSATIHTRYNLFDSIVIPIIGYLRHEHVDFRFDVEVTDIRFYPESDPATVSEIRLVKDGEECLISLDPEDICLVDLGFSRSGAVYGTNVAAPPFLSSNWEDLLLREWRLWQGLSRKSSKFGNPVNFLSRALESGIETFTTTMQGTEFMKLYDNLALEPAGRTDTLFLAESSWLITINVPHQPVFPSQHADRHIVCGYGLSPASEGNFVKKPMFACSGMEIFTEVLSHLGFPLQPILAKSTTIPCGMPLGTAPFLTRSSQDRPHVVPHGTTNFACLGQFAELPDETTLSTEYSVRTAQQAVYTLFNLPKSPPRVKKNILLEVFDILV